MVPDSIRRLEGAREDLTALLENEKDLAETDEYKAAQQALQDTVVS